MQLRDYQLTDLNVIKSKYEAGVTRQLVKWATALGKTVLFSNVRSHLGFMKRVMVVAHRDELIQQAKHKLELWNPDLRVGVEKAEQRAGNEPIVVSSVQSIGRSGSARLAQFDPNEFDALVIDESHRAAAPSYRAVIDHFCQNTKLLLLGVTATPSRADGKGLGEIFQEIVVDRDILWGIKSGYLSELRGLRIRTNTDLNQVKTTAGDFQQDELQTALNNAGRNYLIVKSWKEMGEDRPTIGFTAGVQHAKDLGEAFRAQGVAAEAIWGDDPDRGSKLSRFERGSLKMLLNSDLLVEGLDIWQVSCIIMARSTQSQGKYVQCVGRASRIPAGINNLHEARLQDVQIAKHDALILDFVDNTQRHSLVTMPTLFGLNQDLNLKGRKLTDVMEEVEAFKAKHPEGDLSHLLDIDKLKAYAEEVSLFNVTFAPEIIQLSDFQWHRTGNNAYVLLLKDGDHVTVLSDMLEKWHIWGKVNGNELRETHNTFEEALREADYKVQLLGGKSTTRLAQRTLKKDGGEPTAAQRLACRSFGIAIPPGATFGQVRLKLNAVVAEIKARRLGKTA